jgi:biotin carboxylase
MSKGRTVCIVDAYSTGAELAPLFQAAGYSCVHVQSASEIPADFLNSFRITDFRRNIVASEGQAWGSVLEQVQEHDPAFILPGTETGVPLADFLSSRLGLPGNETGTTALRRDKFEMQEALRRAGLSAIKQARVTTPDEAMAWCDQQNQWPIVVKPLDSAGADSVRFCADADEARDAVRSIIGSRNRIGIENRGALLQERLRGEQYFVNAVSIDGLHMITEIWLDQKTEVEGASLICDKEELLPFEGAAQGMIVEYIRRVLTALGVQNGPSHSELMLTSEGPVLIETAARMQGTILHEAVVAALGASHVTSTVERYLRPEEFRRRIAEPYQLRSGLYCITLQSHNNGIVITNNCSEHLSDMPSFHAMFHTPLPGERIHRTTDLFSNPGIIYLLHENREQLEADYKRIREWEAAGKLFSVRAMQ